MALNDTAHPVSLRQFLQAQAYVVADFFQPPAQKTGSPLITIAAAPFCRCSICCRETSVGGELQSLCLLTQCLWPKFYKFKFATGWRIHPPGWKRENRSTRPSLLRFCISQRKKAYGINRASNNTRLSIRFHCGLDRRTWIWSGAAG
jgi:hypothetical protein